MRASRSRTLPYPGGAPAGACFGARVVSLRSRRKHVPGPLASSPGTRGCGRRPGSRRKAGWGAGGSRHRPRLLETACAGLRWAKPRGLDPQTPTQGPERGADARHSNWGGEGRRAQSEGGEGTMPKWEPGLQGSAQRGWLAEEGIVGLPQAAVCPAALTRIYRQQRRHLGRAPTEPRAARKPQKRARLPGATPEQKGTTLSPPSHTLYRPRRTTIRKSALTHIRRLSPRLFLFE